MATGLSLSHTSQYLAQPESAGIQEMDMGSNNYEASKEPTLLLTTSSLGRLMGSRPTGQSISITARARCGVFTERHYRCQCQGILPWRTHRAHMDPLSRTSLSQAISSLAARPCVGALSGLPPASEIGLTAIGEDDPHSARGSRSIYPGVHAIEVVPAVRSKSRKQSAFTPVSSDFFPLGSVTRMSTVSWLPRPK